MNRFDNLFEQLLYSISEAEGDMPNLGGAGGMPPAGSTGGLGAPAPGGAPPATNAPDPAPLSPEENAENDEDPSEDKSKLVSQKKLQLIKLIAIAIATRAPSTSNQDSHHKQGIIQKVLTVLGKPTTDGTVEKTEKQIITAIAKLQDISPFEVADSIGYTTPGSEEESNRYIDITEYKNLVEIARKALISNPDEVAGVDKLSVEPGDITGSNAEEVLSRIQTIYGRVL